MKQLRKRQKKQISPVTERTK